MQKKEIFPKFNITSAEIDGRLKKFPNLKRRTQPPLVDVGRPHFNIYHHSQPPDLNQAKNVFFSIGFWCTRLLTFARGLRYEVIIFSIRKILYGTYMKQCYITLGQTFEGKKLNCGFFPIL